MKGTLLSASSSLIFGLVILSVLASSAIVAGSGTLSGSWEAGVTFNVQSASVTVFNTQLTAVYRLGLLTAQGIASLKFDAGAPAFDALELDASFPIGGFEVDSNLVLDPNGGDLFDHWRTTTSFALPGASFTHTLYLTLPQTASYQALTGGGTVAGADFTGSIRFNMERNCNFSFSETWLKLSSSICDLTATAEIRFNCSGFESLIFTLSDLPVPRLSTAEYGVFLDLDLQFSLTEKSLNLTIVPKLPPVDCIRLYAEFEVTPGPGIGGIDFYGIRIEETIGGVRFVSATSLDPLKNAVLTGQSDYFELFFLSGPLGSCCAGPGEWSLATYFQATHTTLFDWGMTTFRFETFLSPGFSLSFEAVVRSGTFGDPIMELTFDWEVRW